MNEFWQEENAFDFVEFLPPIKEKLYGEVASIIHKLGALNILDYGTGNGNQIKFLPNNIHICIFDINESFVNKVYKFYSDNKSISIIRNFETDIKNKFDVVVSNMVWMCLNSESEIDGFLKNIVSSTNDNGTIIISMTHPCFRDENFSYYHTSFNTENVFDYMQNGKPFNVIIENDNKYFFTDYHYNLTFFFSKIKQFGLYVENFLEISDEKHKNFENKSFPPYLLITLKKLK